MSKFKRIDDLPSDDQSTVDVTLPAVRLPQFASKVQAAREHLKERALDYIAQMETIVAQAVAKGELEVAKEALQWLIEHSPADDEGRRSIEQSVDKKQIEQSRGGPTINIGFKLGGVSESPVVLSGEPLKVIEGEKVG